MVLLFVDHVLLVVDEWASAASVAAGDNEGGVLMPVTAGPYGGPLGMSREDFGLVMTGFLSTDRLGYSSKVDR